MTIKMTSNITAIASSIEARSRAPASVRSATVAAGPVTFAVNVVPATVRFTMRSTSV
ncbi:Uncharacterised protein [Mycobacterium tuberculosis]|uniref:Uncharacterized protein n=1 Tax=Mycobacterium tuberculosis TaxID=1773 RepID=A0A0T7PBF7_MYCTX|nr:Uncharacterised protein [Mycobacterium tuberculosis]CFS36537.1 Uncharacterised protein [Mycobacterium tuberculosis]CKR79719.1 Uncharacterised protein [Mycobacterium tuberculosis]COW06184.1 Uncharacterised protein [Mycobacterium tuberculosis]COX00120.1 Uncharacterised protein [Mycobacterium tuberculosis]